MKLHSLVFALGALLGLSGLTALIAAQDAQSSSSSCSQGAACLAEDEPIQFVVSSDSKNGLITHDDGLGDTAQREGWYWLGVWIRQERLNNPWNQKRTLSFSEVLERLEPNRDGIFVRAPGLDPFGRDNDTGTTRDQLVPLVAAMGVWGQNDKAIRDALQRLWNALPEDRFGKHDFQGHWQDVSPDLPLGPRKLPDMYTTDPCKELSDRSCPALNIDACIPKVDLPALEPAVPVCSPPRVPDPSECMVQPPAPPAPPCPPCAFGICPPCPPAPPAPPAYVDAACMKRKADEGLSEHARCQEQYARRVADRTKRLAENAESVKRQNERNVEEAAQCVLRRERHNVEVLACQKQKIEDVASCNVKKHSGLLKFTGDLLPPSMYNLFIRAGVVPISIFPVTNELFLRPGQTPIASAPELNILPPGMPTGFPLGELNLKLGVDYYRNATSGSIPALFGIKPCNQEKTDPPDCVDQDMNTLAMLWMAREFIPTPEGAAALASYKSRAHSYGSYFGEYSRRFGPIKGDPGCPLKDGKVDKGCLDGLLRQRLKDGIAASWQPDSAGGGPYGALRWYHRWSTKANPGLAVLWQPIVDDMTQ